MVTNSDVAEVICALGMADRIVGASDTCMKDQMLAPKLKGAQDVGRSFTPSTERILALKPDIVFGYGKFLKQEIINQIQRAGIPVVLLDCYKLKTMAQDIRVLGRIFGREKQAADYIGVFENYRRLVEDRTRQLPLRDRPWVYLESYSDYSTVGPGSGGLQMLEAAGGRNVAADTRIPYPKISPGWVVARNPAVIIKAASSRSVPSGYGENADAMEAKRAEILSRPGWKGISAVKNGRVYVISSDIYTGPRAVVGIAYFAKWIHPRLFADLDPAAIHKETLARFHGLEPEGAWVYPGGE